MTEPRPPREPLLAEPVDEGERLVGTRELVAASRGCLAIIVLMIFICLICCVFLVSRIVQ